MKNSIFRSILIGLLVGLLAFFALKFVLILLIVGAIFKLSGKGRGKGKWKNEKWQSHHMAFVNNIRNMSDEDFEEFKTNKSHYNCHR